MMGLRSPENGALFYYFIFFHLFTWGKNYKTAQCILMMGEWVWMCGA
jgi:hypothetical protein